MLSTFILLLAASSCLAVPSNIVRPCNNQACVARQLAARSRCNPAVRGWLPNEYLVDRFRFDTPVFNATYFDNNLTIRNHDKCFVSQFFVNIETQIIVLGLDCPGLEFESTRTVVQHYSLAEDMVYDYSYQGTYPLIRLTLNLPYNAPLDVCRSFTFADVTARPHYRIKPNNLKTANFLSRDDRLLDMFERETFYYRASLLARYFINSLLCDFGCNF